MTTPITTTTRRTLIRITAVGAALLPLLQAPFAGAASVKRAMYERTRYATSRHRVFRVTTPQGAWTMTLTKVEPLAHARHDPTSFALTFRAHRAGPPQGTYRFQRPGFAATPLFVVPDRTHRSYVAIVNHAHRSA